MSRLNIYRLSGLHNVSGSGQNQQFNIWSADSDTLTNTRAANFVLARINALLAKIKYTQPTADTYNELDLYVIILNGLSISHREDDKLRKCGYCIQAMINDGFFAEQATDEENRIRILDEAEAIFETYYANDVEVMNGEFVDWYEQKIIANNYNDAPQGATQRLREFERQNIGSLDPSGYRDLASYVADAGIYFLYMFIGEKDIKRYSAIIRKRYRKELDMFDVVCINCDGVYDRDTVYDMLYAGCSAHYNMTPEQKIEQLRKLGKNYSVGALGVDDIIAIISLVVTILSFLLSVFTTIFQFVVQYPQDYEEGVPDAEDWDLAGAKASGKTGTSKLPILLLGAAALLLVFNKKKKKE